MHRSRVLGIGMSVPSRVVTNHELATKMETSHDWIIDNLARMQVAGHAVAARVLTAVGLTTHVPPLWRNYAGATKSYYGVSAHNPPAHAATLHAMVVTASWTGAGALTYNISGQTQHY